MRPRNGAWWAVGAVLAATSLMGRTPARGDDKATFADQVAPILRARCNSCHNADKAKGGLNLETFGGVMRGGGSGKVVEAGDPENSRLLLLITHAEEPKMPPESPRIPDAEIGAVRRWIEGGAAETAGGVAAVKARPRFEFKLDAKAAGKPAGPAAMPEGVSTEPAVLSARPPAVLALAASPWAPLVAVAGHKQVLLYHSETGRLAGVLPFPEGAVTVLKFSRNGSLLLAGGGRGGQSGLAAVWDVRTGRRAFEIGREREYDTVLAADISPDHGQVAVGGPGKVVRVYSTADGRLQFELRKHTDWVTALEFSPDGVLLATGDRNNGLVVWESQTGREFHDLRGHASAVTDVSWRPDSDVLASADEAGLVKLWEMENGTPVKSWSAHGGGVASARFALDGRLATAGRDRVARLWDRNGNKQREFEPFPDLALDAALTHDGARLAAGSLNGEVRLWDARDGRRLADLKPNPAPLADRLADARAKLAAAELAVETAEDALAPLQTTAAAKAQGQAARALDPAPGARQGADGLADGRKADLDRAAAERAEADKALDARRPALRRAELARDACKAEVDALTQERQRPPPAPALAAGADASIN